MTRRVVRQREEERAWIAGLRAGDLAAFERIYNAYFLLLWEFAARTIPSDLAEDIVQDVLFALWRRHAELEVDDYLGPYLFAAVRSKVIQYVRHEEVVESVEDVYMETPLGMGEAPQAPDEEVSFEELQTAVHDALGRLSEQQRTVLTLRWTQGMTYDEIATVLGISREAAKKQGARAQKIVKPLLEPYRPPGR